jgi:hypothetical protein
MVAPAIAITLEMATDDVHYRPFGEARELIGANCH